MARVFYQGSYSFRSVNGLLAMLMTGTLGTLFMWVSFQCLNQLQGQLSIFVGVGFIFASIGLLSASLYVLVAILIGRVVNVTIATDGVTHGKYLIPWEDIYEFYGTVYANGICLGYTLARHEMHKQKSLLTTPLLTKDRYRVLTEEVQEYISATQRNVRIESTPKEPTGT